MNIVQGLTPPEGISLEVWERLAKAESYRWAIAERNDDGQVIGTAYRDAGGRKKLRGRRQARIDPALAVGQLRR